MASLEVRVRGFQHEDTAAVREICVDTAIWGSPIDPVFSDRELFADIMTDYYLEKESDHCLVAEAGGRVVGYLLGSVNPHGGIGKMATAVGPALTAISRQLAGKYRASPQNAQFLKWMLTRVPFENPSHPKHAAHCHLNMREGFRGQGIGTEFLRQFYSQVRESGLGIVYEEVFAHPAKPEEYFRDAGFEVFDSKRTTMFQNYLDAEVSLLCITKRII
jgi:GNAT superfamily N-acetyltransferase